MRGAVCILILVSCAALATAQHLTDAYPGRSLLHDNWGQNNNDCKCKNANWWCYGYCNLGTKSGDSSSCFRDCLVCCGWGAASASPQPQGTPAPTPMPQQTPQPASDNMNNNNNNNSNNNANAAPTTDTPATNAPATNAPAGLTKAATSSPVVRVVNTGRRLQQQQQGQASKAPPSSPAASSGGGGDWKHGGGEMKKPDPNQCWNSFWAKYPWK